MPWRYTSGWKKNKSPAFMTLNLERGENLVAVIVLLGMEKI